jgi:microcystin-dependent protein
LHCQGQLLPISQNQALFSLLGTNYGGDGRTTFGLPDLRGRVPVGQGVGPGLSPRMLGEMGGRELAYLTTNNLPAHTHFAEFTGTGGSSGEPLAVNIDVNVEVDVAAKVEVSTLDGTSATASTESECYLAAAIPGPSGADQPEKIYRSAADGLGASPSAMHVKTASTATATASGTITGSSGGITGGSVINHNTGGSLPFSLYQPCLGLNYDMCIQGIFPSRN